MLGRPMPQRITPDPAALALAGVVDRFIRDHFASVRDAARTWEMNDSTIGKILNNPTRFPRPATMQKLAAGMGMPLRELYALCGMTDTAAEEAEEVDLMEAALRGIDAEGRRLLSRMTPEQKAALMATARALLPKS